MIITYCVFAIGVILFILGIVQWNLHAEDGWIGETWDSKVQENLYYKCLAPISTVCIFASLILTIIGI